MPNNIYTCEKSSPPYELSYFPLLDSLQLNWFYINFGYKHDKRAIIPSLETSIFEYFDKVYKEIFLNIFKNI
jgi:hypothetical protein